MYNNNYDRPDRYENRQRGYQSNNFDNDYADSFNDAYNDRYFDKNRSTMYDRPRDIEEQPYDRESRYDNKPYEREARYDKQLNRDNRLFNDRKFRNPFTKREKAEYEPRYESKADALTNGFGNNMIIYSPKTYNDVKKLIDFLKKREPIIVDLAEIKHEKGQRILDFLSGAIYAINGSMHKISGTIYLLTPDGLNIMVPTELEERLKNND